MLFGLAILVLGIGIWLPTGLTGKDEFYLGLRTPLEMMARDVWLVPYLDELPRIRKPPLLYWLGRASFEVFGPSLAAARGITVLFGALLVVATAGIAQRLTRSGSVALVAALVILSSLGLATEARRFMLDIPTAACSASALWAYLIWREEQCLGQILLAAALLAAGFLFKGPVAFVLVASAVFATLKSPSERQGKIPYAPLTMAALLFALLALPWFGIVRHLHPEAMALAFAGEVENRQFFHLSHEVLSGPLQLALPWSFLWLAMAWRLRREKGLPRQLLLWTGLSLLPFLFAKTFDRYLVGSLVPMAILLSLGLHHFHTNLPRWASLLGAFLALLMGAALAGFAAWFDLGGWYWWLPAALYLAWAWWRPGKVQHLIASAATYWVAVMAGIFPVLGVNHVPAEAIELGNTAPVAYYDGPQPALLSIFNGKAHRHLLSLDSAQANTLAARQAIIFVETGQQQRFLDEAAAAGVLAAPIYQYQTLASHGSGLKFAKTGATREDWQQAFNTRDLTPLKTDISAFQLKNREPAHGH